MRSAALDVQGKRDVFHGATTSYPGDFITFTFENGTTLGPLPWKASFCCQGSNGPLQTMDEFYDFFVLGRPSDKSLAASTTTISKRQGMMSSNTSTPNLTPVENPAYPSEADVIDASYTRNEGAHVRGYFLHDTSLAVLSVPHFAVDTAEAQSFSNTVKEFLARSTNAGMKKVVIDVQQNSGGSPLLVLEVFKIVS